MEARIVRLPDGRWAGRIVEDKKKTILIWPTREELIHHLGYEAKDVRRINEIHDQIDGSLAESVTIPV